jgi:hypothetical protein
MPRTIEEGFRDFLKRLTPSLTETEAAKRHRASIEKTLKRNFGLERFFRSGSFGNGTSIRAYSDIDYFAVIPTEKLYDSSKRSLQKIRGQLNTTFHSTNVRVSDPAIVCPFGFAKKETTEIIPCDIVDIYHGYPVYDISDTNDSWMKACPEIHNAYIKKEDERLAGKLKPLIRFIKAWKYYNNVKISSFYLELRIAKLMKNEENIVYSIDIDTIISWLYDNNLSAIQDPMGISGYIYPCKTELQKKDALSKLQTAKKRIAKAREYENNDEIRKAFRFWNLLFNEKFPSYYRN